MSFADNFTPIWPFRSGWAQTIASVYAPQRALKGSRKLHTITLLDGDQIVVCDDQPDTWTPGTRVIVLVHGLTGSAFSKDTSRLGRVLFERGFRIFRVNLRNCGPGFGMAKKIYHSGRSEDTRAVIEMAAKLCPGSPVTQIGFSLGGNITLKMAGEDGISPTGGLDSVVAICPPADLAASSRKLSSPKNRIFDRYFVKRLQNDVEALHRNDPQFVKPQFPKTMTLRDFDDMYTAPCGGFTSGSDYYEKASSLPLISKISCATLIIGAEDDPVVDMNPLKSLTLDAHKTLIVTKHGGHCGYIGYGAQDGGIRWMDHVITMWIDRLKA